MSTIILRSRQDRTRQNNHAFALANRLLLTVKALIQDGFTIHNMGFGAEGTPVIEIQHCKRCERLCGVSYKREHDTHGTKHIWQKMINDCRVEWTIRGDKQ